jgi:hypothetical protein
MAPTRQVGSAVHSRRTVLWDIASSLSRGRQPGRWTLMIALATIGLAASPAQARTAPRITISVTPAVVTGGDRVVVSGRLRGSVSGSRRSLQLRLEERVYGGAWRLRATTRPNAYLRFAFAWRVADVQRSRVFRVKLKRRGRVLATSVPVTIAVKRRATSPGPVPTPSPPMNGLVVSGNRLLDGTGKQVQLRGVNRAAFESACAWTPASTAALADGPTDAASVDAMVAWKINTVRVALNAQCWLGVNGLPGRGSASDYQQAIKQYVALLRSKGMYVILESHVTAPGVHPSNEIDYMPDADHSPLFWTQVAGAFKTDGGILFDPINEIRLADWNNPSPSTGAGPKGHWRCWRDGCTLTSVYPGLGVFQAAGMQSLVDAIRGAGATQPIMLGGLNFTKDQSQLMDYLPNDKALIIDLHAYDFAYNGGSAGFDSVFNQSLSIAQKLPLVIGELGETECDVTNGSGAPFTHHVLYDVLDRAQTSGTIIGVLGWTWNAGGGWSCPTGPNGEGGPLLIRSYDGTPTTLGTEFKTWFATK